MLKGHLILASFLLLNAHLVICIALTVSLGMQKDVSVFSMVRSSCKMSQMEGGRVPATMLMGRIRFRCTNTQPRKLPSSSCRKTGRVRKGGEDFAMVTSLSYQLPPLSFLRQKPHDFLNFKCGSVLLRSKCQRLFSLLQRQQLIFTVHSI